MLARALALASFSAAAVLAFSSAVGFAAAAFAVEALVAVFFVVAFFVAVMRKATATLASTGASATCAIGAKSSTSAAAILSRQPLGHGPLDTPDPFLFCVYHYDNYPAGDKDMQAPKRGNGADFNPNAPYRMYHGDRVPGFPQHPHRGFETITATITGLIDHTDSLGNAGRYGDGDLCWMTAGSL